jgi:phosphatidylglycerophosphatase A
VNDEASRKEAMSRGDRLRLIAATCFGLGYSPIFPGTAGALLGVAIYIPIGLFVTDEPQQTALIALGLLLSCYITIVLAPWAERHFQEKDSGIFVTDEVAGFLLTILLFRVSMHGVDNIWITIAWAFPVTRIIDIIKVPPAKKLEKLPAGWGVVADDLLGSVYAAALLHLLAFIVPAAFGIQS